MDILDDYERMSTSTGSTSRERTIFDRVQVFNETAESLPEFENIRIGEDDSISDTDYKTLIYSDKSYKEIINMKTIIFFPDTPENIVTMGQYIRPQRQGGIYLLLTTDTQYSDKLKGGIKECNINLEYINDVGNNLSIPCIYTDESGKVSENKYMVLGENKRAIIIPDNEETIKFKRDDIFKLDGLIYEVVSLDRLTDKGVLFMTLDEYQEGIIVPNTYTINIQQTSLSLIPTETSQLNVIAKENDTIIERPIIYTSSDTDVATVNETGLVTAAGDGTCTITVKFRDNEDISDSVSVEVAQVITPIISYRFNVEDLDELTEYDTNDYGFYKYDNNIRDNSTGFTFEIDYNGNSADIVTLNIIDDNNCQLVANKKGIYGTIILIANEGANERGRKEIVVKSLWG